MVQDKNRVGEVEFDIRVRVGRIEAGWCPSAEEEPREEIDAVRKIDVSIRVDVTTAELRPPEKLVAGRKSRCQPDTERGEDRDENCART